MSVELTDSETLKNLMRAFAGESQARNRYTFAASLCKQQSLPVLEAVFQFTANQEKEHAEIFYNHMKPAAGRTVSVDGGYPVDLAASALQLLRRAQHNEYEEFDPVYPQFGEIAAKEGFSQAAAAFRQIAKIEKTHGERFGQFAQWMESGRLFASETPTKWVCLNCGHIVESTEAPHSCPVCAHPQGYFIRQAYAPYTMGVTQA